MSQDRVVIAGLSLALFLVSLASTPAEARLGSRLERAELASVKTASLEGDCCVPKEPCCPEPCIKYHHCGPKLCCGCEPPKEITLKVKNPCTGCEVDVPICLPACCKGEPEICCGKGLFCRDVVEYEWCCGFRVKVIFRHCGDLLVKTWGY
ncbi:MAG: hypothetical protein AB7O59_11360 [Pirellulales bacterium]